jgi:hypothetical protein
VNGRGRPTGGQSWVQCPSRSYALQTSTLSRSHSRRVDRLEPVETWQIRLMVEYCRFALCLIRSFSEKIRGLADRAGSLSQALPIYREERQHSLTYRISSLVAAIHRLEQPARTIGEVSTYRIFSNTLGGRSRSGDPDSVSCGIRVVIDQSSMFRIAEFLPIAHVAK